MFAGYGLVILGLKFSSGATVITKGGGRILLVTLYVDVLTLLSEIFQFHTSIIEVVIGGTVIVVLITVLSNAAEVVTAPGERVIVLVTGHATCKDVSYGGNVIVVRVGRVIGGRIRLHEGLHWTAGSFSLYIFGLIYTSPDPLSDPSGSAPESPSVPFSLWGVFRVPGPPRSSAHEKRPPRQFLLAKSAFCLSVLASSKDILK